MTKKNFIALADTIKAHNAFRRVDTVAFTAEQINSLADFCAAQNPQFNRGRWLGYIAGTNGKNGGKK
jgi:hypothetical protein